MIDGIKNRITGTSIKPKGSNTEEFNRVHLTQNTINLTKQRENTYMKTEFLRKVSHNFISLFYIFKNRIFKEIVFFVEPRVLYNI